MNDFGQSLFRLHGGQGTKADILSVLGALHSGAEARSRMLGLGSLVRDAPISERRESAVAMVAIYFVEFDPVDDTTPSGRVGSTLFIQKCCPPKGTRWQGHVLATYNSVGKATMARLSKHVVEVLEALEHFWNLSGELVAK